MKATPKGGPAVAVRIDNDVIVWQNGFLMGNQRLADKARVASIAGEEVRLHYGTPYVRANLEEPYDDYLGVAAALVAISPGRAFLVEAPDTVWDFLEKHIEVFEPGAGRNASEG